MSEGLVSRFLQKSSSKSLPRNSGVPNSFQQLFSVKAPTKEEINTLTKLLKSDVERSERKQFSEDIDKLVAVSSEVKAIQKQGVLLIGERISKARKILANYNQGKRLLTKWMQYSFSSMKTAYNALAYYELYQELPTEELKEKYKTMPAKAGYILASRNGDLQEKCEIIRRHTKKFASELIEEIQNIFPLQKQDKRQRSLDAELDKLHDQLGAILKKKHQLSHSGVATLQRIAREIDQAL